MKILIQKGLEAVSEKVEDSIGKALLERQNMGLSLPPDTIYHVGYYQAQAAKAMALLNDGTPEIYLNVIPIASDYVKPEGLDDIHYITNFFDTIRLLLRDGTEGQILEFMEYPLSSFDTLESSPDFDKNLKTMMEAGFDYDAHKVTILKHAPFVKEVFDDIMPLLIEKFNSSRFSTLRHELDHADFFCTPIFRAHQELEDDFIAKISASDKPTEDASTSNLLYLESCLEVMPLVETRAMFFNHIPPYCWVSADYPTVNNKILSDFINNYVEATFSSTIVNSFMTWYEARAELDRETENYLYLMRDMITRSFMGDVIKPDMDQVNYDIVTRVLYEEVPRCKAALSRNAINAVGALSDAYKFDPSRFIIAKEAKTIEDYLYVCRG